MLTHVTEAVGHHATTQPHSYVMGDAGVDVVALATALRTAVRGEVRFDDGSRALYATDGSNYRQVPIGVIIPRDNDDVIAAMTICRKFGAPVLSRGGGTSLAGQCCNVAIVFDFSKYMNGILELDPANKLARVQPGCVLDSLRDAAEQHHLTFAPDPSTHTHCTLGGMIGNNSCGVHSMMGGKTDANVELLDVLLYDGSRLRLGRFDELEFERAISGGGRRGQILQRLQDLRDRYADEIRRRFPDIPRRVSGYNLDYLLPERGFDVAKSLVGSEGTCVMVLEATLRLVDSPPARSLVVLGYPSVYEAGDHIPEIRQFQPIGLEGLDDRLVDDMIRSHIHPEDVRLLPEGAGWLLCEFGGETKRDSDARANAMIAALKRRRDAPMMKLYDDPPVERMIWKVRESGLGATAHVPGAKITWEGWEDSAVPPERLGSYLRKFRKLLDKFGYACALYGHFGQGCVHTRIDFDLESPEGIAQYRSFVEEAADLAVDHGGSLSGEHGDGQSRAELLPKMFGPELIQAFEEFKSIWDPDWKMNPGKVVRPYRVDQNLRLGADYNPPDPKTHFQWPTNHFSWARTNLRCVGIGDCRRHDGGTMCPSYRVTMEEMHSTRGRARLLWEMLHGSPLTGGWRSEPVRESLDLCLSCKGCKGDCPVNVDMASYKSEFLSHYYEGRLRPRQAYAMGLINVWARLASKLPGLANFVSQTPIIRDAFKWLGGIARQRKVPAFAQETFRDWFFKRPIRNQGCRPVILWADTFNNHFFPEVAKAAVDVLENAGFQVRVPEGSLCCGRPLYDYGMLDRAERYVRDILYRLQPELARSIPIVVLEPSCAAVFRDELTNLLPHDEDAKRLAANTHLLSEFLVKVVKDFKPPPLRRKAIVHGHCHHKAIMKMTAEEEVLKRLGLDFESLDSGCCGMAGSFGFEREHYDVSQAVGELVLLPAVRSAGKDTLIIADGFSCREQIAQATDRQAVHLAQVLQMALRGTDVPRDYPESVTVPDRESAHRSRAQGALAASLLVGGALAAAGWFAWRSRNGAVSPKAINSGGRSFGRIRGRKNTRSLSEKVRR
ncbi:MAG TPA: FAD-linked oxidase C-terminal domain-containing protein [Pirellulales bacterium]|nr:FAD-linked oxidase C-terminal domain-containing protein [Pirellulales bacterium]